VALSGDKAQRFLYVADGHNERVRVLDRQSLAEVSSFGMPALCRPILQHSRHRQRFKGNVYVGDGAGAFKNSSIRVCRSRLSEDAFALPDGM